MREVVFNEGLKTVGKKAFRHCRLLQSISIPSIFTELEDKAFYRCTGLREIVMNDELKKIGQSAYYGCSSLQSITIPPTVNEIGGSAFNSCGSIREVELHEGLQKIGGHAFRGCYSLERLTLPSISVRLEVIIQAGQTGVMHKIDAIRGNMIERRGYELFVPGAVLVIGGDSNRNTIRASLDQIVSWIRYHEMKEATSLFELALWKAKLDQADEAHPINREAYRIEVPGPGKDAILQYLG